MNEAQAKQIQELVQEIAERNGISFDAAFKAAMGAVQYHAIDVVPWGKEASFGSGSSSHAVNR